MIIEKDSKIYSIEENKASWTVSTEYDKIEVSSPYLNIYYRTLYSRTSPVVPKQEIKAEATKVTSAYMVEVTGLAV